MTKAQVLTSNPSSDYHDKLGITDCFHTAVLEMLQNFLDFEQELAAVSQICITVNALRRWPLLFDVRELNLLPDSTHWSYVTWHYCEKYAKIKSKKRELENVLKEFLTIWRSNREFRTNILWYIPGSQNSGFNEWNSLILRTCYLSS